MLPNSVSLRDLSPLPRFVHFPLKRDTALKMKLQISFKNRMIFLKKKFSKKKKKKKKKKKSQNECS